MCEHTDGGGGIYGSATMIKVFPLRGIGGSVVESVWGCTTSVRETEVTVVVSPRGTKNMLHPNEDFHLT